MYPVLKLMHMLNFLDTFSMGITTRVLIFYCLTSSVSNASHISLEVLQWDMEWYSLNPREEMRIFCAFKSYWTFFLSSSLQSTTLLILCYTVGNNLRLKPPIDHDVLHVHIHRLDVNTHAFFPIVIIFSVENRSSIIRPLGLLASHMDQLFR